MVHGIRIREVRPGYYLIRLRRKGQSHSETFGSLSAAKLKANQLHNEYVQGGLDAFSITPADRESAKEALRLIEGRTSIIDAVTFWKDHHPNNGGVALASLVQMYLEAMAARGRRPCTIKDSRCRLQRLCVDFGDRAAASITPEDFTRWMEARGVAGRNRNNYRRVFHALYAFATKRGIAMRNPLAELEPIAVESVTPAYWTAGQVKTLLKAAKELKADLLPALSIMAFAGLRPYEVARLDWSNINLSEQFIRVLPGTSKTRTARLVDIPENLLAWLATQRRSRGAVSPPMQTAARWRPRLGAIVVLGYKNVSTRLSRRVGMKGADIKQKRLTWEAIIEDARKIESNLWPVDVLRHTYATFHLATHNEIGKLAEQMGSSGPVIRTHYKGLATAKEAAQYWSIMPDETGGKVIELRKTAQG